MTGLLKSPTSLDDIESDSRHTMILCQVMAQHYYEEACDPEASQDTRERHSALIWMLRDKIEALHQSIADFNDAKCGVALAKSGG